MNKYPIRIKDRNGEVKFEKVVDLDKESVTIGYDPEIDKDSAVKAIKKTLRVIGRTDQLIWETLRTAKSTFYSYKDYSRWPTKKFLIGLAFLAEYNMAETHQLLSVTNWEFVSDNRWDAIVMTYIENGNYDLEKLNVELTQNGLEPVFD
jgi:hypothetical protein